MAEFWRYAVDAFMFTGMAASIFFFFWVPWFIVDQERKQWRYEEWEEEQWRKDKGL